MESGGSLVRSQELTTGPYSEPDEFRPQRDTIFLKISLNIILPSMPK
jgi:hypothetical protein